MCGRFANSETIPVLSKRFRAEPMVEDVLWTPTWNAAPSAIVPAIIEDPRSRRLGLMRWGWAGFKGRPLINARGETAHELPSYAEAVAHRRCLIPATAWYEWQRPAAQRPIPHAFATEPGGIFAFAALWKTTVLYGHRQGAFVLITTEAEGVLREVHHRRPVLVPEGRQQVWLDQSSSLDDVRRIIGAPLEDRIRSWRVGDRVNKAGTDGPDLLLPPSGAPLGT